MQQTFSSPPSYAKGEKLTVLYNPADPQESYPDNLLDNYFGCLVGAFSGWSRCSSASPTCWQAV